MNRRWKRITVALIAVALVAVALFALVLETERQGASAHGTCADHAYRVTDGSHDADTDDVGCEGLPRRPDALDDAVWLLAPYTHSHSGHGFHCHSIHVPIHNRAMHGRTLPCPE